MLRIPTARAFLPLLKPARYKGAYGGRGGAKSHFVAERLLEDCVCEHQRVACLREYQSSIAESSKRIIEDKIRAHGLGEMFRVTEHEISGPNDSLFIFRGLQSHNASNIKSLEGFTRSWVEEAQTITQSSLDLLLPTFRKNSELWFTWNPVDPKDPVDKLFRENEDDPDFISVFTTYADNPWFPDDLRREMERDRRRDPEKYAHVWLGEYQSKSEARVFHNWKIEEFETPADARFYFGADWGYSIDPTVLIRCWIRGRTLFVDWEAYKVRCEIDNTPALFDTVPGARRWTIRADSARPETISYMKRQGFRMSEAVKGAGSVEDGIEFLKSYDIVVHPRCRHTADELSRYQWKVDKKTEEVLPQLKDKDNHVIDALRYALEGMRLAPQPFQITDDVLKRAATRR